MKEFKKIIPAEISDNFIKLIGADWMLVTAGDESECNTMTASWGGVGYLWNKPVAIAYIRPQRHTFAFTERQERMTLSFFEEEHRPALAYCGTHSGKDEDKILNAGLTTVFTKQGTPTFREARLVLECRKLYTDMLKEENFLQKDIIDKWYANGDYHKVYVLEIENAYIKKRNERFGIY